MNTTAEKSLRSYVRRANRWFAYCEQLTAERIDGTPVTMTRPAMPSKDAKHRAYGDAGFIARDRGVAMPNTFPELCALVGEPCSRFVTRVYA